MSGEHDGPEAETKRALAEFWGIVREREARQVAGEPVVSTEQAGAELEWSQHLNELLGGMPEDTPLDQQLALLDVMGLEQFPNLDK